MSGSDKEYISFLFSSIFVYLLSSSLNLIYFIKLIKDWKYPLLKDNSSIILSIFFSSSLFDNE